MALALVPGGAAQGNTLIEGDVVADLGGFADDDTHAVVDEEAPADPGPGWISMPVIQRPKLDTRRASHFQPDVHKPWASRCSQTACRPG